MPADLVLLDEIHLGGKLSVELTSVYSRFNVFVNLRPQRNEALPVNPAGNLRHDLFTSRLNAERIADHRMNAQAIFEHLPSYRMVRMYGHSKWMYFEQRELEEGTRHGYEPRSVAGGFTRPVRHDINAIHAGVK